MRMFRAFGALLLVSSLISACNKAEATAEARPTRPKAAAKTEKAESKESKEAKEAKAKAKADAAEANDGPRKFVVPFAWEASRDEPLSQARAYLKEILSDNRIYMEHGPKFFASFAEGQKPRATVLSCADSRVHTSAFDTTPENDDFMVRNIGNQLENGLGSVEYGVEHLQTPVLLILGHSGCGAVKAAMGDISTQSEAVRHELEHLHIPKAKPAQSADAAWSEGVVANVHAQVSAALTHFGSRVQEGKLTIVGAVYDFRNDLGHGSGKITIIDVNGNGEQVRMDAFVEAIDADASPSKKKSESRLKAAAAAAEGSDITPALAQAITRAREMQTAPAPAPAKERAAAH
jgi:carbonic anhydrase